MLRVETDFETDAYGNLYGCYDPITLKDFMDEQGLDAIDIYDDEVYVQ